MSHLLTLLNQLAPEWTQLALEVVVKGTCVMALGATLLLVARKLSAALRHLAWTATFATLLLLPLLATITPAWRILPSIPSPLLPAPAAIAQPSIDPSSLTPLPATPTTPITKTPARPDLRDAATTPPSHAPLSWQSTLLLLWSLGTLLALTPIAVALLWTRRLRRTGEPLLSPDWTHLLRNTRALLNLPGPVTLLQSPRISMPLTIGILRPCIVLPADAHTWTTDKRRLVLLHELAHVKRLDLLSHTGAAIARAFYWFHPLAWAGSLSMALERERACDDLVISVTQQPQQYAEILIAIARQTPVSRHVIGGLPMARISTLETRIRSLIDHARNRATLRPATVIATLLATLAIACPLAMIRSSTAQSPAPPTTEPNASTAQWTRRLPDGTTVELAGICANPTMGPWWLPNGAPTVLSRPLSPMGSGNQYLLKISGFGNDPPAPIVDVKSESDVRQPEPIEILSSPTSTFFYFAQSEDLPSLRIGLARGPWHKEMETAWNSSAKSDAGQIAIGQPSVFSPSGPPAFAVQLASTFDPRQTAWRLIAVDADGNEHPADNVSLRGSLPPLRQYDVYWSKIPPATIKSLRFETRPIQWIEFTDFVTDPGGTPAPDPDLVRRLRERRAQVLSAPQPLNATPATQPAPPDSVVYVMGDTQRPGVYSLSSTTKTLLQTIAMTGISKGDVASLNITVLRRTDKKDLPIVKTTLADLLHGSDANIDMQAGDVILISGETKKSAALREQLQQLRAQLQMVSKAYGAQSPEVQSLKSQIDQFQKQLDDLIGGN